jgi:hypothetical protein
MPEQLLIRLDVGLPGALLRVGLGAAVALALRHGPVPPSAWASVLVLLAALFGLKACSAVGRRVARAYPDAQAHWEWRRGLARDHDSYQWRKLTWVGIGLVLGAAGGAGVESLARLGVVLALAGVVAEVVWRRKGLSLAPPRQA